MITKFLGRLCSSMQLEKKADSFYRFLYRREKLTPFFDFTSVQFSRSAMSDSLQPHKPQHTKPPCPSLTPITTQTHVHWVSDAIQPSCPLLSPSSPAFNLSQHQGFFKWVRSSHEVAKVFEFQLQYQSFQWKPRTDLL